MVTTLGGWLYVPGSGNWISVCGFLNMAGERCLVVDDQPPPPIPLLGEEGDNQNRSGALLALSTA